MTMLQIVERERVRLRRKHVVAGLALAVAATAALVAVGVLALGGARWMALPRPMPFLVWMLVLVANALVARWTWMRQAGRGSTGGGDATRNGVAAAIEREQALRAGALRGVLEVGDTGALGRRAARDMSRTLEGRGATLAPATQRRAARFATNTAAAALIAGALLGWVAPTFGDGLLAILLPVKAWRGTLLPKLAFRGLPPQIMRGEQLRLDIVAPRRRAVTLNQRTTGEVWKSTTLAVAPGRGGEGVAHTVIGPVRGDVMLVVSDGRTASDTAIVRVTDRPFVGAVTMRAAYPAYLGRAPEGLPIGEPARIPRGTIITMSGRASAELRSVRLVNGSEGIALHPNGHAFSGEFEARKSGKWGWEAAGPGGPITDVPLPVELEVVPDSAPRIELVSPATDTLVAGDERVSLKLTATDDHGLAAIELRSWRQGGTGQSQPVVTQRLASNQSTVWSGVAELDLSPRGLQPGDALHVKVVAIDNSPWAQTGESRELLLRIPTSEERRAMARDAADSAVQQARSAVAQQRALEQRTDQASRDRTQRGPNGASNPSASNPSAAAGNKESSMTYAQAERDRAVAKDQRALMERVKALQQAAAALEQQLKQAGALDSSLTRQLREAQALLKEALTPELQAQMEKLESATQQLSGDQARAALKDLAAMQQRLREQLEKSAEMLKRAAYEGAMQTLKDEAKEIADRERKMADSAAKPNGSQDEKAKARELAERSSRFADEVKKLKDRLERDKAEAGATHADEARQHAEASQERMKEAADALDKPSGRDSTKAREPRGQKAAGQQPNSREEKSGESKTGEAKDKGEQTAEKKNGQASPGQKGAQGKDEKSGTERMSQRPGAEGNRSEEGQQGAAQKKLEQGARDAASQMDKAAQAMQAARESQIQSWKKELTGELDQSIQEMLQMARDESAMEQKARSGEAKAEELRGQQSALQQGVDKTAQRLQQEGQKTSLLSGRSQRAMGEAKQKVSEATQSMSDQRGGNTQAANALGEAADALNRAAASLARDREKANTASSASGFSEMLQQLQEMAKKQGSINAQAQGLMPMPGGQMSSAMQATSRTLARQQRQLAQQLDELGDAPGGAGDRAAQLAKDARQLAEALDGGRIDATTLARQQQLFRRMLDAGRSLEKDERDDTSKREAKAATGADAFAPDNTNAGGRSAQKFREPNWNELRGLTAEERRAILDYFKRINAQTP